MCDLLGLFLLVRHLGKLVEQKGRSRSEITVPTIVLYLGCEIGGVVLGFVLLGDQVGAMLLGLVGIVIGIVASVAYANSLTPVATSDQEEGRFGPSHLGPQVAGGTCVGCSKKIFSVFGASPCPVCGQPCHDDCRSAHVHEPAAGRVAGQR